MSKVDLVQVGSNPFTPTPLFKTGFQTLGNGATLQPFTTGMVRPQEVLGGSGVNPIGIIDGTSNRIVSVLLMFGITAGASAKLAVNLIGFSSIRPQKALWLSTQFFLGEAEAGSYDCSPLGEPSSFLADQFDVKTFASGNINYIEPADGSSAAVLLCDVRGFDILAIRLAQGGSTAATKAQVWWGAN